MQERTKQLRVTTKSLVDMIGCQVEVASSGVYVRGTVSNVKKRNAHTKADDNVYEISFSHIKPKGSYSPIIGEHWVYWTGAVNTGVYYAQDDWQWEVHEDNRPHEIDKSIIGLRGKAKTFDEEVINIAYKHGFQATDGSIARAHDVVMDVLRLLIEDKKA